MTQSQFLKILKMVQSLHTDFEEGINDEQAYDLALFILDDNPGLKNNQSNQGKQNELYIQTTTRSTSRSFTR